MKTNNLITCRRRRSVVLTSLAALVLSTALCRAQDVSCKVVADAQNLLVRTSHHTYSTEVRRGRSIVSESIAMPGGVYWGANGVWHKSAVSMQEFARQTADALKELRGCRHVADELTGAQPSARYSLHNEASGGDETVWIANGSGLVLRSEALFEDRRISSRYEYGDLQPPAHVQ